MQSQLACSGCRNILLYPRGATNVRCAVCSTVTPVQNGWDMDHLICAGCRTLLMYTRGAASVRCLCCHTVNLTPSNFAPAPNQVATISCGGCRTRLVYPSGASSVKCAVCQYITNVGTNVGAGTYMPSTSMSPSQVPTHTVVVENPMSRDESGKLVSNVVVGVTTERK